MRRRPAQCGSATVAVLGLAALAVALASGVARLGAVTVSRAKAETAADAAALAAAAELAAGRSSSQAARTAESAASSNGARLVRCDCTGGRATVTVALVLPRLPSLPRETRVTARAEIHTECPG